MSVFIYGLVDPRDNRVRYVGKSTAPKTRLAGHLSESRHGRQSKKNEWLRGLLADGMKPTVRVLEEIDEGEWEAAERKWITKLEGLLNLSLGGAGPPNGHLRGRKKSPEHARLLRERLKKYHGNCKGRKQGLKEREKRAAVLREKLWGRTDPLPTLEDIKKAVRDLGDKASTRKVAALLRCSNGYVRQMPKKRYGIDWEDLKRGVV